MSDILKAAVLIALGIVVATAIYIYFSPFQSCVREQHRLSRDGYATDAATFCAHRVGN
jgi:hypothetical protein